MHLGPIKEAERRQIPRHRRLARSRSLDRNLIAHFVRQPGREAPTITIQGSDVDVEQVDIVDRRRPTRSMRRHELTVFSIPTFLSEATVSSATATAAGADAASGRDRVANVCARPQPMNATKASVSTVRVLKTSFHHTWAAPEHTPPST
jgi:hypothetical protein